MNGSDRLFFSNNHVLLTMFLTIAIIMVTTRPASADPLVMRRMTTNFPDTMVALQAAISEQGYTVSRVQRVDIGLTKTGHKTDRYRLVFFGKGSQIRRLLGSYPELSPYLPLKFVIYAEADSTLILINSMENMKELYPEPKLASVFDGWNQDIIEILESTRQRTEE